VALPQVINVIPVANPRGHDGQLLGQCDSDERQDVGMRHPLPDHGFAAEPPLRVAISGFGRFDMNQARSLLFRFRRPMCTVTRL